MSGYTYRTLSWDDLPRYYELYATEYTEIHGAFTLTIEEFREEIDFAGFNPETDLYGAFSNDGKMIGYAEFWAFRAIPVRPSLYGYTHPAYRNQGIATNLVDWGIDRARQVFDQVPPEARIVLQFFSPLADGRTFLSNLGAVETRQSWFMLIEFDRPPAPPSLPEGFRFVTMAEGATVEEIAYGHHISFRDQRGSVEEPFEDVLSRWQDIVSKSTFMPDLFAVIKRGDDVAGVVVMDPITEEDPDRGWVSVVGVLPDYRRRGLGLQLLRFAFSTLHQLGKHSVGLNVDGASLTGATNLYKKAGMHVDKIYYAYELELRAGIELSNQGQHE